ncbi:hypothetical protein ACIBHX_26120 [Nonomuraea sp. NPDC050536]|uniref:hypothetical protein n=1 Tax=Nonomuraea sp. NPDC050536 TaxID=3364366 RepID=UPI0037C7DF3A
MKRLATLTFALTLGITSLVAATPAWAATREIPASGTTTFHPAPSVDGGIQDPEIRGSEPEGDARTLTRPRQPWDRSQSQGRHQGPGVLGSVLGSHPKVDVSFNGLNFRDQRTANGGNQFSVEPPDQGMCAGNGFVLESLNDVLRVYDTKGNALIGTTDLNTFYGYPPAIDRTTGVVGPEITDPTCYYDNDTRRWFQVVLTLDVDADGNLTGHNHLDLAVSKTASPLGQWTIYKVDATDDGTNGTPAHPHCPCIGDYPHIGADLSGFYITTNEYSFFGPEYNSAQIYAFPKRKLAQSAASVPVQQYDTTGLVNGKPGFTIWPAQAPSSLYSLEGGGTEYFLSSNAAEEAQGTGSSTDLIVWKLSGTLGLDAGRTPVLSDRVTQVGQYSLPPKADQKAGSVPLADCINDTTTVTPAGTGCWRLLSDVEPGHDEVESVLDANDTRMQQTVYALGLVWGALDTAVTVGGQTKAGVEYFAVNPRNGKVVKQGYLAVPGNNLTYPAVGVDSLGRGVIAMTLVGADHYPSAAYAPVDVFNGAGTVQVVAEGAGPQDGFSGYKLFGDPPRPRWGDYGAAAMDGRSIWIASEYIAQTCTLQQWLAGPIGSCGGTRAAFGNWATRISRLTL